MHMQSCCMVMRLNLDCNACCRKTRRIILQMKGVETHMIDKQQCTVTVCGRFRASDVAIKLRKKMKRRVEILHIEEEDDYGGDGQQHDHPPPDHHQDINMSHHPLHHPAFIATANGD
ncbi:unnamed protein product [Linum tenue]|uniref:HMA domain-containing protein n=1 Tax=Linum tenue TaxID=586396 RepID=A0AAV0R4N3_9ROSI|nr:unnamed protein product [Linum tenue]